MTKKPSPCYSFRISLEMPEGASSLSCLAVAVGSMGGEIMEMKVGSQDDGRITREILIQAPDSDSERKTIDGIKNLEGFRLLEVIDCTFHLHQGGKIELANKVPLQNRNDLAMAYTPGVARICLAIKEDIDRALDLTIKKNAVAIVSDGTAVLGLGDIGPTAALPVMEGKAMLFKSFGGIDAFPICLNTKDPEEIISAVKWLAPVFGGINLEDISAPRCFEIEQRLKKELDIPVFHDDQHGTAVVILAALINALKLVNKHLEEISVVVCGLGAAGMASISLLFAAGVRRIIGCDRNGILYRGRQEDMNPFKAALALKTNPEGRKGGLYDALQGADVFIGLSKPGLLQGKDIAGMARDPIVFAMANPIPEIMPEEAQPYAAVVATGRSDYANQVNNVLCFPGLFRGVLDCHAREINEAMLLSAVHAIASSVKAEELKRDQIIPSIFDATVHSRVAAAVREAAHNSGVSRSRKAYVSPMKSG
ncbi:MAG: NAD-dependent malic enzyme [Syntrophus sp. PtaU1.Bin208]|nr:MAG: NAD-dependent malic enzyme [Syntrophus sp. PtaU1.Bin208]